VARQPHPRSQEEHERVENVHRLHQPQQALPQEEHERVENVPQIDQVIESTAGCDLLCFLDCYSGYHQIAIKEEDQEKTAFITPFSTYCYTTMSFWLKNTGATYQRAIQACFKR
jgi:hypothetical protein